jgi:hypothetical protein
MIRGFRRGSIDRASRGERGRVSIPAAPHARMKFARYSGPSSGRETNRPSVGSMQWGAIRRRMRFSVMHSRAAAGSLTA